MMAKVFRGLRHPLRAVAMAMAALSLAWGISLTEGLVAAMAGAVLGVVAGELLGRSRLRMSVALGGLGLFLLLAWKSAGLATATETLPEMVGPGNTLVAAGVIRFGSLAFALTAMLRTTAVRRPAAMALELGFIAAAFTTVFASHREGVISRPLWLSDWAWQQGIDPATVLLAIGAGAVALLAVLLIAESRSGRALSSLVALIALAVTAVLFINVVGPPTPPPANDLGLTDAGMGQPPHPQDAGRGHGERGHDDAGSSGPREGGDGSSGGSGTDGGDASAQGHNPDGGDDATGDGGGGSSGQDGGDGGGSGASDGGDGGGGSAGGDGGDSGGLPPPEDTDGGIGQAPPPQDGGSYRPPPSSERLSEDQTPSNSPAPMAIVLFDDDYSPPSGAYYFRQEAWSQYNGTRLVASTRTDVDLDVEDDFPTAPTPVQDPPSTNGRTRVHGTVAALVEHTHPFALESPVSLSPAVNPNPTRFLRAWRFESLAQSIDYRRLIGRTAGDHRWSADVRQYYVQGPTDPRYAALAHQIVNRELRPGLRNDPFAEAAVIQRYLNHELIYSTRHRHANTADPTADFLFGDRTGYCVHFAHSAVFLWRSLGIPARISAGYHSDESNRHGGSALLIRGGDAHAWPELYLDGLGWIVFDIAAERNIDPPGNPPDEDLQRLLGEMARQQPPQPDQPRQQPEMRRRVRHRYGRDIGYAALFTLLGTLAVLYATKLWRRVIPSLATARSLPRVGYRKALDQLAEAGLARQYGETREGFAKRVTDRVPSFDKVTALHLAARLGDPQADPATRDEYSTETWRTLLKAVRAELPAAAPLWRRVLGLLHPASFLDAR